MSAKNRIDPAVSAAITRTLYNVLANGPGFLNCPLSEDEMVSIWQQEFHPSILAARQLMIDCGYLSLIHASSPEITFFIPEKNLGVRWVSANERPFLSPPKGSPHMIQLTKIRNLFVRGISIDIFRALLGEARLNEFLEWAVACAAMTVVHTEVKTTIQEILKMLTTAGQLRRMVPELVNYLPPDLQRSCHEQKRASPFPGGWAEYPKDKVERLLLELARCHLLSAAQRHNVFGTRFNWAENLPQ